MSVGGFLTRMRAGGRLWNAVLVVLDAAVVVVATVAAYYVRFEGLVPAEYAAAIPALIVGAVVVYGVLFALFGQYRLVLRYVGVDTLLKLSGATVVGFALLTVADFVLAPSPSQRPVPIGVLITQALLVFLGASAARLAARVLAHLRLGRGTDARRVLIVGGGDAGSLLLRELQGRPDLGLAVVGFLDDDKALKGRTLNGIPILGTSADLAHTVEKWRIEEIIVAMPSAPRETIRRILNEAADAGVQTRVMPTLVIAKGSVELRDLRPVDVEDLLGREPTPIDVDEIAHTLTGKVIAVTGAAGSIGSELCRQVMRFSPERLLLIEIDESRLYELWLELGGTDSDVPVMCVCDIRDAGALDAVFTRHRPDLLLHAAAYKHVPLMEIAPDEAVKTNVLGTAQVIEACERHVVERFVLISTDKAVEPVNIMGLTKSIAEKIMLDAVRRGHLNAVAVRFGNVLASRGSVVPIFEEQLRRGGPLTVTDPEVTRYFMTIPEAARLVLQAQAIGKPGNIFVLEMGEPVKIVDLARKMIALSGVPADVTFVGLRPGEKLHETLVNESEKLLPTERAKILLVDRVALPEPDFSDKIASLVKTAKAGDLAGLPAAIERLEAGFAERAASK